MFLNCTKPISCILCSDRMSNNPMQSSGLVPERWQFSSPPVPVSQTLIRRYDEKTSQEGGSDHTRCSTSPAGLIFSPAHHLPAFLISIVGYNITGITVAGFMNHRAFPTKKRSVTHGRAINQSTRQTFLHTVNERRFARQSDQTMMNGNEQQQEAPRTVWSCTSKVH